jgi:preprotein translocase subunit SecY
MAGVIPIIFAISLILFPSMIAQFFANGSGMLATFSRGVISLFANQFFYATLYFILVFGFTYFYTAVIFQPQKIAENLQRQGGFVPGIRPGKQTEEYLQKTMFRLVFIGALFLGLIAILPLILKAFTGTESLVIGGTSLLIIVSVAIETTKQIDSQMKVHEYDRA